jgi:hypothetical protein
MTDRELLEAAGRAAGLTLIPYTWNRGTGWDHDGFTLAGEGPDEWNPLEDDGQALRLAVALRLSLLQHPDGMDVTVVFPPSAKQPPLAEQQTYERNEGMRRAIVRAAAAMAPA